MGHYILIMLHSTIVQFNLAKCIPISDIPSIEQTFGIILLSIVNISFIADAYLKPKKSFRIPPKLRHSKVF